MKISDSNFLKKIKVLTASTFKKTSSFLNESISRLYKNFPITTYDKRTLLELLKNYLSSVIIITVIVWIKEIYVIYNEYVSKGVQVTTALELFIYSLPYVLALTIPSSTVMAVILTYNRLSSDLEILSLRITGIRKVRIFLPVLIFSLLIGALSYWFFDTVLIRGNELYLRTLIKINVEKPLLNLSSGKFVEVGKFKIGFESLSSDGKLLGLEIYQETEEFTRIIKSIKGEVISSSDLPYYTIHLENGTYLEVPKTKGEKAKGSIFSSQFSKAELRIDYEYQKSMSINLENYPRAVSRYKLEKIINNMPQLSNLKEKLALLEKNKEKLKNRIISALTYTPNFILLGILKGDKKSQEELNKKFQEIKTLFLEIKSMSSTYPISNYNQFLFEYYKKTSIPFSTFFFGILGFGIGLIVNIRTGKSEAAIIGVIAILIQSYIMMVMIIPVMNGDISPELGAWIGNIIIAIPGLYLLFKE